MKTRHKGAALITVILILLVLTVLGIAAAVFMTQEDRTSARQDLLKAALYIAEAGLRRGEPVMATTTAALIPMALQHVALAPQNWRDDPSVAPTHPTYMMSETWTVDNLGTYLTDGGAEVANREIPLAIMPGSVNTGKRAFYSLYVRNNPEDLAGAVTLDGDGIFRLVSVGWVTDVGGRVLAVKILEEEFDVTNVFQAPSAQKQGNQGGTGQGLT